jgi:hypothetical protein
MVARWTKLGEVMSSIFLTIDTTNNFVRIDGKGLNCTEEDLALLERLFLNQNKSLYEAVLASRSKMGQGATPHDSALWLMYLGPMQEVLDLQSDSSNQHITDANGYVIREPYARAVQLAQNAGWPVAVRLSSNVFGGERGMYLTIFLP